MSSHSRTSRSRASGASRRTSSCRRERRRRSFSPASDSAGRLARLTSLLGSSRPNRTPTSARAHSDGGSSRNRFAAVGSTSSSCCPCPLPAEVRTHASSARTLDAGRSSLDAAGRRFLSWLTLPDDADAVEARSARGRARRGHRAGHAVLHGRQRRRHGAPLLSMVGEAQIDDGIERLATSSLGSCSRVTGSRVRGRP